MKRTAELLVNADRYRSTSASAPTRRDGRRWIPTQDAWYFGTWANPESLKIVKYCEGSLTVEEYETPEEFTEAMEEMHRWAKDCGYWLGVDPGIGEKGN